MNKPLKEKKAALTARGAKTRSSAEAFPSKDAFRRLAREGKNVIPVYKEILADTLTPVSAFLKLGKSPSFLFESVVGGEKWARYSFLGLDPGVVIKGHGRKIEVLGGKKPLRFESAYPVEFVREFMKKFRAARPEELGLPRFFGGLVGYIGYDMVRFIEELPDMGREDLGLPDLYLMLTDTVLIFDYLKQNVKVLSNVRLEEGKDPGRAYGRALLKIDEIIKKLRASKKETAPEISGTNNEKVMDKPLLLSSIVKKEEFEGAVEKAKEYIKAGDIFQVVLSQRFEKKSRAKPFSIYRALRVINPSPYMYYLDTGDAQLVGSSPEILVRLEGEDITLRPIAGTRKRGRTEEEDRRLEEELKADPKEKAEHLMLVDLGRNDVGRVAGIGTVHVPEFMIVERYSHVMHMVSNVEGKLARGMDAFDVLAASFPAGTVSGAPKVRAMEIIEELEPTRRGPYAGAVGYFGFSGNMDTCITIRTLIVKDGMVYVQAGAGIVADSVPENEYKETVNKAMAMMEAVKMAEDSL
jgi:anthranilate synthase component 1